MSIIVILKSMQGKAPAPNRIGRSPHLAEQVTSPVRMGMVLAVLHRSRPACGPVPEGTYY